MARPQKQPKPEVPKAKFREGSPLRRLIEMAIERMDGIDHDSGFKLQTRRQPKSSPKAR